MPPGLKAVLMSKIQNVITGSTINNVLAKRNQEDSAEDHLTDFERTVSEYRRANSKWQNEYRQQRINDPSMRDKNAFDDEQKGMFLMTIQMSDANSSSSAMTAAEPLTEVDHKNFHGYNHHHFCQRWGTLGDRKEKDEEWWIPEPVVLADDDPSYLCEMCRHINFKALFNMRGLPGNNLPGPTKIQLHCIEQVPSRPQCAFCHLITSRMHSDGVINPHDTSLLMQGDLFINVLEEGGDHALRLEVEISHPASVWPTQRYILHQIDPDGEQSLLGRKVDPLSIDVPLLKTWIELCEQNHAVRRQRVEIAATLRVIDVVDLRICEVDALERYVCLSYVWGGATQVMNTAQNRQDLRQHHGLLEDVVSLPNTIRDAIKVVSALGIRYLWVDSLCIEQDNDIDKQKMIARMAQIYGNAILTIAATSNKTPADGLPGVSNTPRINVQRRITLQGIEIAMAFHDMRQPVREIEDSIWNTRGWTYQERQLSPRTVYFTHSQMIFICDKGPMFEDTVQTNDHGWCARPMPAIDAMHSENELHFSVMIDPSQKQFVNKTFVTKDGTVTYVYEDIDMNHPHNIESVVYEPKAAPIEDAFGIVETSHKDIWALYAKCATAYSRRHFTYASDVLPAFQGLEDMIRQGSNIRFWYNLPECAFDRALLWYHSRPTRRRQGVDWPSWSWTSWDNEIKYRAKGWRNSIYFGPVSVVKWVVKLGAEAFLAKHRDSITPEMVQQIEKTKSMQFFEAVNPYNHYCLNDKWRESGWQPVKHETTNDVSYVNNALPSLISNYPFLLSADQRTVLPDMDGVLHFETYRAAVRFCDMKVTEYIKEPNVDAFLQIGLNDEERSANARRPEQRIIYHQGYRAGFLTLDMPFAKLDLYSKEYSLIAMSRDQSPFIQSSQMLEFCKTMHPAELQYHIGYEESYDKVTVRPPHTDVEPNYHPMSETGDPNWDEGRFQAFFYPIYNVLLVQKMDKDLSVRIGIGLMNWFTLHHAHAERKMMHLC